MDQLPPVIQIAMHGRLWLAESPRQLKDNLNQKNLFGEATPAADVVSELRSQALEVQSELEGLKLGKEKKYRAGMLGLAMSFVIYGVATQSPAVTATSIATLLAALAHLRDTERKQDSQHEQLLSTPAYALLRAKELLRRR
jgi:hypothetical protein